MKTNIVKHLLVYMYENDHYPNLTVLNSFFIKHQIPEYQVRDILLKLVDKGFIYVDRTQQFITLGSANEEQKKRGLENTLKNTQVKAFLTPEGSAHVQQTYINNKDIIKWSAITGIICAILTCVLTWLITKCP